MGMNDDLVERIIYLSCLVRHGLQMWQSRETNVGNYGDTSIVSASSHSTDIRRSGSCPSVGMVLLSTTVDNSGGGMVNDDELVIDDELISSIERLFSTNARLEDDLTSSILHTLSRLQAHLPSSTRALLARRDRQRQVGRQDR